MQLSFELVCHLAKQDSRVGVTGGEDLGLQIAQAQAHGGGWILRVTQESPCLVLVGAGILVPVQCARKLRCQRC